MVIANSQQNNEIIKQSLTIKGKEKENFQWVKNWYPVSPIDYLDPKKPNSMTLLGKKLVIWKNKQDNWVVMDDICPHKLVELSTGKIDSNAENIICRYHGWCFDSTGNCTKIPAIDSNDPKVKTACSSDRARVNTYPSKVIQDLLWVWPDDKPEAETESSCCQPAIMPEDVLDITNGKWFMSEVPVGYAVSVENSFDPIHAQFLHEGIGFFSPDKAVPIDKYQLASEISKEGFILKHSGYNLMNKNMEAIREFKAPCSNTTIYTYTNGAKNLFQLYFVPTKPGYCRYIGQFLGFTIPKKQSFWKQFLPKDLVIGLEHSATYKLGDQDLNAISCQEIAYNQANQTWSKAYYLPATSDFGSIVFRKWLEKIAGGDPFGGAVLTKHSDEKLYDRWHRHSKHCPQCRNSIVILEKIRTTCDRIGKILILLALASLIIELSLKIAAILTIFGLLCLWSKTIIEDKKRDFMTSIPKHGLPEVNLYQN